jgi:hypothetical protein
MTVVAIAARLPASARLADSSQRILGVNIGLRGRWMGVRSPTRTRRRLRAAAAAYAIRAGSSIDARTSPSMVVGVLEARKRIERIAEYTCGKANERLEEGAPHIWRREEGWTHRAAERHGSTDERRWRGARFTVVDCGCSG